MIVYFDSSSLVKLYVEETYSDLVQEWWERCTVAVTGLVAKTEVLSALGRRQRDGSLRQVDLESALEDFYRDWNLLVKVDMNADRAGNLALAHGIRGFDAIHLDCALTMAGRGRKVDLRFSSFDSRQKEAARAEGLRVLEP